jgi:hypothetical protein
MNHEQLQQQINALQAQLNQSQAQSQRAQDERDMLRYSEATGINPSLDDPFSTLTSPYASQAPVHRPQTPGSPTQASFADSPEYTTHAQFSQGRGQYRPEPQMFENPAYNRPQIASLPRQDMPGKAFSMPPDMPRQASAQSNMSNYPLPFGSIEDVPQGRTGESLRHQTLNVPHQQIGVSNQIQLAVNRPQGVQINGGNNVTMNIPLPDQFDPEKDSWNIWKKSLQYFFRTINLPFVRKRYT